MKTRLMVAFLLPMVALAEGAFTLVGPSAKARIAVSDGEPEFVLLAAKDLQSDVKRITGKDLEIVRGIAQTGDVRIATGKGAWESYDVAVKDGVLAIEGADARGTMFGVYDFIEKYLKVDPLAFWNDMPYPKMDTLAWENVSIHQGSPTTRFRGWFINDEDLLTCWKEKGGDRRIDYPYYSTVVNPEVMEHLAEALVRCRFNLIIPASFIDIANPPEEELVQICARRGVYLSQHHVEPMGVSAFTYFNYWKDRGRDLPYSYFSQPAEVEEVWRDRAARWANYPNVIWQIGLRGIADRPMWKADPKMPKSDAERADIISRAMAKQVQILDDLGVSKENRLVSTTLWAEGSYFNQHGLLKIPAGTIVVFADNCAGWEWPADFHETKRVSPYNYGVYYHHGLIGSGPHLASLIPAARTHRMMKQAHEKSSDTYAIFNVSDIREFVYGIDATSKMLWNLESFDPETWTKDWVARHHTTHQADWLSAYNAYYSSLVLHPDTGHPLFLDGLMNGYGSSLLKNLPGVFKKGFAPQAHPFAHQSADNEFEDAFLKSLKNMHKVGLPLRREYAAYLAKQRASHEFAFELAQSLYEKTPESERAFAYASLVHPAGVMVGMENWLYEVVRAYECATLQKRPETKEHLQKALDAMDGVLQRAEPYCSGKWENWYRDCRKINLRGLRVQTEKVLKTIK